MPVGPGFEVFRQLRAVAQANEIPRSVDFRDLLEFAIREVVIRVAATDQQAVAHCEGHRLRSPHVECTALPPRDLFRASIWSNDAQSVGQHLDDLGRAAFAKEARRPHEQEPIAGTVLAPVRFLLVRPRQGPDRFTHHFRCAKQTAPSQRRPRLGVEALDFLPERNHDQRIATGCNVRGVMLRGNPKQRIVATRLMHQAATRREVKRLNALVNYAEAMTCRRQLLLSYFGETAEPCGNCDVCLGTSVPVEAAPVVRVRKKVATAPPADPRSEALMQRLKTLRMKLARTANVPAYVIFSDRTLADMAARVPKPKR